MSPVRNIRNLRPLLTALGLDPAQNISEASGGIVLAYLLADASEVVAFEHPHAIVGAFVFGAPGTKGFMELAAPADSAARVQFVSPTATIGGNLQVFVSQASLITAGASNPTPTTWGGDPRAIVTIGNGPSAQGGITLLLGERIVRTDIDLTLYPGDILHMHDTVNNSLMFCTVAWTEVPR